VGQVMEATTALLELAPTDAHAHDLRGWALLQSGDYDAAQVSLERALSLDPALASAHYHLGQLWTAQGNHQQAQGAYIRALDLDTTGELVPLIERAKGGSP
jgi:tetratricopeptide (TPR) repeat protein